MNSGEDSAFPMVSSSRSFQQSPSSGSRQGAWAHNLWEECILPEGKTPRLAEPQGLFALALSTWMEEFRSEYKYKWEEGSKVKERHTEKSQNEEATRNKRSTAHHGWYEQGVTRACRHLSHVV